MEKISAKASKIYNLLEVRHCEQDNKGIYCIYSRKEIAKDGGTNEKTVQRALNELEEKNYISRTKQGGNREQKIYFVLSNSETVPSNSEIVPSNSETVPSNSKTVPSNSEIVPSNSQTVPSNSETVPSNSETVPSISENEHSIL